jgi:hypothetical protein
LLTIEDIDNLVLNLAKSYCKERSVLIHKYRNGELSLLYDFDEEDPDVKKAIEEIKLNKEEYLYLDKGYCFD